MSGNPPKKRKEANPLPWVILVVALIVGGIWFVSRGSKGHHKTTKAEETMTITLPPPAPPPPPPPPPPPTEPPPQDEKEEIVEEEPIDLNEPPEATPELPAEDLSTNVSGNGPDLGLTRGGGNGRIGGSNRSIGKGSPYNRYALRAKATIEQALRSDPVTRKAIVNGLKLQFWPSADGEIIRASIIGGSSDPTLDQAIKRVLIGLKTQAAATSAEMPPSVKIRITARKATT